MGTELLWTGGAHDPVLDLLTEQQHEVKLKEPWMLRVTHVRAALAARGYPAGLRATLHLSVHDPLIPGNSGPVVLEVDGQSVSVTPGGDGRLQHGCHNRHGDSWQATTNDPFDQSSADKCQGNDNDCVGR